MSEPMGESQKITILLAEYNTLRNEVIAARANVAQAIGLVAVVLMGILGLIYSSNGPGDPRILKFIFVCAAGYLGFTLWWNEGNTRTFTRRLREIERDVNKRAGERLLLWETKFGWGSIIRNINKNYKGYTSKETAL